MSSTTTRLFNRFKHRLYAIVFLLLTAICWICGRIIYLSSATQRGFLQQQGEARSIRTIELKPRGRGMILDRHGQPLAISIPSYMVWVDPKAYHAYHKRAPQQRALEQTQQLATLLELTAPTLDNLINARPNSRFAYLYRQLPTERAQQIAQLKIPGIYLQNSYKRHYPKGETVSSILGITNIEDVGQDGLELLYDEWLSNDAGKAQVLKDCKGHLVKPLRQLTAPNSAHNLTLSIDQRIQTVTFHELTKTVQRFHAESGSVVVLAVRTGEILAMANIPSFDPNRRSNQYVRQQLKYLRNRALTDLFEPGSIAKIFTAAAALKSGQFTPTSRINTNPGVLYIDRHAIRDVFDINNGVLTLSEVLQKSSDVGTAKIALQLPGELLLENLHQFGLGQQVLGFPGEPTGRLPHSLQKRPLVTANLSFGYAFNVTLLQMARAYAIIANHGVALPTNILKQQENVTGTGTRVLSPTLARQLLQILEECIALKKLHPAQVKGYRVAGKTGTAHISSGKGGYYKDRYYASFVGIAPVSKPEIVIAIVIRDPKGEHFGSKVAAPLFGQLAGKILHILQIPFDKVN